jgi:formylglycine-generating enzyme required for sulfatase activity
MINPSTRPLKVFLCHASADKPAVRKLYRYLRSKRMDPWLDEFKLLPGQKWEEEILKALYASDAIVVVLSQNSITKEGYVQREIKFALDKALDMPEGRIFLIPARLEECEVPKSLKGYQWVDLFQKNWNRRLMSSLNIRVAQLGLTPLSTMSETQPLVLDTPIVPLAGNTQFDSTEVVDTPVEAKQLIQEIAHDKTEPEIVDKSDKIILPLLETESKVSASSTPRKEINEESEENEPTLAPQMELTHEVPLVKQQEVVVPPKVLVSSRLAWVKLRWVGIVGIILFGMIFSLLMPGGYFPIQTDFSTPTPTGRLSTEFPTGTSRPEQTSTASLTETSIPITPTLGVGSIMISETDGMVLLYVPAGEFTMGSNNGNDDEKPVHTVYLDSFWIDETEVTNAMYSKCEHDGKCGQPSDTSSYDNSNYANHPVLNISWNHAKAYCEWADRRLPTEAEWEKAARGTDQRAYPWGNDAPNNNLLNYYNNMQGTTEVGKYPNGASPYGALDMAGNVWEWVSSLFKPYPYSAADGREDLSASGSRALRGGSWSLNGINVRSANRDGNSPLYTEHLIGFRCAMSATP